MHPVSGVCLLEHKFGELDLNPDLVAGFFHAISDFAKILSKGKGEARIVDMGEFYLTYASSEMLSVAAVADKTDNQLKILKALDEVIDRFTEQFGQVLKNWDGCLVFFSFKEELQRILEGGRVGESEASLPRLKCKLPRLMVQLGQISEQDYRVASQCSGTRTPQEIAKAIALPREEVEVILHKLKNLDLIEYD